jgi:Fe2+ or Zn2+ uptake regulation protein
VIDELHDVVALRLRREGQRYTAARRALVDVLATAARPLTIPEVLALDDALALSSAYRNLVVLDQAGVVVRIVTADDHARYELAEDLTGHHHHLVCVECGAIEDFELPPSLEADLGRALRQVARRADFGSDHHRLDLVGRCTRCR